MLENVVAQVKKKEPNLKGIYFLDKNGIVIESYGPQEVGDKVIAYTPHIAKLERFNIPGFLFYGEGEKENCYIIKTPNETYLAIVFDYRVPPGKVKWLADKIKRELKKIFGV